MVLDWFESVEGQPLTCIIQVNSEDLKNADTQIKLPAYLQVEQDITDKEEFKPRTLARIDFNMKDQPKENLNKSTSQIKRKIRPLSKKNKKKNVTSSTALETVNEESSDDIEMESPEDSLISSETQNSSNDNPELINQT